MADGLDGCRAVDGGDARDWDPLVGLRRDDDPPIDVLTIGTIFHDIVFSGFDRLPQPGEEVWTDGLASAPGGIANLAVASARLGLRTALVAGFGDDVYANWIRDVLGRQEGIDLTACPQFHGFHTAMTVSMACCRDRAMVTHGHDLPVALGDALPDAPQARLALVDLKGDRDWFEQLRARGVRLVADAGFDDSGRWDPADLAPLQHCEAFLPNAVEAMGYTRQTSVPRAVARLSDRVPLVVVTAGGDGAWAIDQTTGEQVHVAAVPVETLDATGAGDTFDAAMALGILAGWPLRQRLDFAALAAGLAVSQLGGSLAAPGWGDLADWWRYILQRRASDNNAADLARRFGFLDDLLPTCRVRGVRRAEATFAIHADV